MTSPATDQTPGAEHAPAARPPAGDKGPGGRPGHDFHERWTPPAADPGPAYGSRAERDAARQAKGWDQ